MKASLYTFDLMFSIADDLLVLIVLIKGVNSSMVISAVSIWALLKVHRQLPKLTSHHQ